MSVIDQKYKFECEHYSDIYEHLPTLYDYARQVNHITECGVRTVVSSYAFAKGLKNRLNTKLIQVDIQLDPNVIAFKKECENEGLTTVFYKQSDLDCPIEETDLLFIDTWHVYGHLKRELARWHTSVRQYIIMHDTTVDEWLGETIRCQFNPYEQSLQSGIPVSEIIKGLWPAIEEFLSENTNWILEKRWINNNGLTVLRRKTVFPISFSIPECKIINHNPEKTKKIATVDPRDTSSYIFKTETEYYKDYQKSVYGKTCKKGGWDCLRHYEILANGCIPLFEDLESCPKNTMTHFPKELVKKAMTEENFNTTQLLNYTRQHLTTKAMAKYILSTIGRSDVKSVLYLSQEIEPDYLRCLTLHGFKELFGKECHDYPCIPHLYTDYANPQNLYGRGMTYTCLLDKSTMRDDTLDSTVEQDIISHRYDIIIFGSVHRGTPFWDIVNESYKPHEIVLICGEDLDQENNHNCEFRKWKNHNLFIREQI